MSATAGAGSRHARPRTRRRSLWRLRFQSGLPRYVLYAVAVVAIVRMALPSPAPRRVSAAPRSAGVDLAAGSFAVSFTRAYLSYSGAAPQRREARLAPFVGSGGGAALDQDAGVQLPDQGSNEVVFAQLVSRQPGAGGDVYTVQADTSRDGIAYVAVTVARNGSGELEVVGEPAFVGPPPAAAAVQDPSQQSAQVSDGSVTSVVARALTNYLRGDQLDLQSDLASGVSVSVPPVALRSIEVGQASWVTHDAGAATVGVDVQAADESGATYGLHYTVSLRRQPPSGAGRWFVSGIESNPSRGGA
jgi:hypothetical protein